MEFNVQFVKQHWKAVAGGLVAVFLIVYLYRRSSGSSGAVSSADQVQGLSAAASLANNQANSQQTIAAYQASVATRQSSDALTASLADTAAKLAATNLQTTGGVAVALDTNRTAVAIQQVKSTADVTKTKIVGSTLTTLAATSAQRDISITKARAAVTTHIYDTLAAQHKLGGDSTGVAQVVSAVYGKGPEAIAANQPSSVANSSGAILSGVGSIARGLFL